MAKIQGSFELPLETPSGKTDQSKTQQGPPNKTFSGYGIVLTAPHASKSRLVMKDTSEKTSLINLVATKDSNYPVINQFDIIYLHKVSYAIKIGCLIATVKSPTQLGVFDGTCSMVKTKPSCPPFPEFSFNLEQILNLRNYFRRDVIGEPILAINIKSILEKSLICQVVGYRILGVDREAILYIWDGTKAEIKNMKKFTSFCSTTSHVCNMDSNLSKHTEYIIHVWIYDVEQINALESLEPGQFISMDRVRIRKTAERENSVRCGGIIVLKDTDPRVMVLKSILDEISTSTMKNFSVENVRKQSLIHEKNYASIAEISLSDLFEETADLCQTGFTADTQVTQHRVLLDQSAAVTINSCKTLCLSQLSLTQDSQSDEPLTKLKDPQMPHGDTETIDDCEAIHLSKSNLTEDLVSQVLNYVLDTCETIHISDLGFTQDPQIYSPGPQSTSNHVGVDNCKTIQISELDITEAPQPNRSQNPQSSHKNQSKTSLEGHPGIVGVCTLGLSQMIQLTKYPILPDPVSQKFDAGATARDITVIDLASSDENPLYSVPTAVSAYRTARDLYFQRKQALAEAQKICDMCSDDSSSEAEQQAAAMQHIQRNSQICECSSSKDTQQPSSTAKCRDKTASNLLQTGPSNPGVSGTAKRRDKTASNLVQAGPSNSAKRKAKDKSTPAEQRHYKRLKHPISSSVCPLFKSLTKYGRVERNIPPGMVMSDHPPYRFYYMSETGEWD